jgi:hypothetical protein
LSCFTEPSSQDPLLDQSLTSPYLDRASSALVNLHVHQPPKLFNPQTDMRFTWPPGGQDRLDHTLPSGVYIARLRTALSAGDRTERRVTTPSIRSEAHMAATLRARSSACWG